MITDPWCYGAAIPAVRLTGLSRCGFGAGFGALATPLLALAVPVPHIQPVQCYRLVYAGMFPTGAKRLWGGLK